MVETTRDRVFPFPFSLFTNTKPNPFSNTSIDLSKVKSLHDVHELTSHQLSAFRHSSKHDIQDVDDFRDGDPTNQSSTKLDAATVFSRAISRLTNESGLVFVAEDPIIEQTPTTAIAAEPIPRFLQPDLLANHRRRQALLELERRRPALGHTRIVVANLVYHGRPPELPRQKLTPIVVEPVVDTQMVQQQKEQAKAEKVAETPSTTKATPESSQRASHVSMTTRSTKPGGGVMVQMSPGKKSLAPTTNGGRRSISIFQGGPQESSVRRRTVFSSSIVPHNVSGHLPDSDPHNHNLDIKAQTSTTPTARPQTRASTVIPGLRHEVSHEIPERHSTEVKIIIASNVPPQENPNTTTTATVTQIPSLVIPVTPHHRGVSTISPAESTRSSASSLASQTHSRTKIHATFEEKPPVTTTRLLSPSVISAAQTSRSVSTNNRRSNHRQPSMPATSPSVSTAARRPKPSKKSIHVKPETPARRVQTAEVDKLYADLTQTYHFPIKKETLQRGIYYPEEVSHARPLTDANATDPNAGADAAEKVQVKQFTRMRSFSVRKRGRGLLPTYKVAVLPALHREDSDSYLYEQAPKINSWWTRDEYRTSRKGWPARKRERSISQRPSEALDDRKPFTLFGAADKRAQSAETKLTKLTPEKRVQKIASMQSLQHTSWFPSLENPRKSTGVRERAISAVVPTKQFTDSHWLHPTTLRLRSISDALPSHLRPQTGGANDFFSTSSLLTGLDAIIKSPRPSAPSSALYIPNTFTKYKPGILL